MMKWWGWGDPKITFSMAEKPTLWPFIRGKLHLTEEKVTPPIARQDFVLPPVQQNAKFLAAIKAALKADQITSDDDQRLHHCYGKSFPNLFWARKGYVQQAPDLIVFPESHEDVVAVVEAAAAHDVCVIPFGGGTNIVGGVDPRDDRERMIVTLNMQRMNRVLSIDPESRTAVIEAGALGPKLEKDLQAQGWSLGHAPDSFEWSTLGGWLATRSAGMQSDEYGKIEHMAVSITMVTPAGTIVTREVPASSAGPDLNHVIMGSEGVLGVITKATMRVHRAPAVKDYRGFLFKTFEAGVAATQECIERKFIPSMVRLQDSGETELAMHMKAPKKGLEALVTKGIKAYLKNKGYTAPCLMVVGFEGNQEAIDHPSKMAFEIMKKHGGFPLGTSVGKTFQKSKFDMPYLRDYVMDYSIMCDVSETSATWTNVLPVYHGTIKAIKDKFARDNAGAGYVGCHISHTYETGACLYFTYAAKQIPGKELEQYYGYKKLITDEFMRLGATLTHHHAVGYEHMAWMKEEVGATGLEALRALKAKLDPKGVLNPGKLIPAEAPAAEATADDLLAEGLPPPPRATSGVQPSL